MGERFDLVVVGGGPAGYVASVRAAQLGLKTACVDKGAFLGGTCLNVGCIPSKALLHSSLQYEFLRRHAQEHGISCDQIKLDFPQMMQRKADAVQGLVTSVDTLLKKYGVTWLKGTGQLTGPHTVSVTDHGEVEAANILLAAGSSPVSLPMLPFDEERILSSTGALSLKKVPQKMIVVGAGVIGVELASVYQRLGTEVVIVEMLDTICPAMDHAVSRALLSSLKKQGIVFHLGVKVVAGKKTDTGVTVTISRDGKDEDLTGDVVLVAVGRKPYSQDLGLDKAGVAVSARGFVQVDGMFRTSVPHIYAVGDLIEGVMLAHRASEEGAAVAEIIAGHHPIIDYASIPNVIYTHPEAAAIGLTEAEAKQANIPLLIGTCHMKANPRARATGDTEGLVKLIGDQKSGRLIGMHLVCASASEMIGEGVIAMRKRVTLAELADASHAHPTLAESIKEAAQQALGRAIHI